MKKSLAIIFILLNISFAQEIPIPYLMEILPQTQGFNSNERITEVTI
jgi:hypothetical protein